MVNYNNERLFEQDSTLIDAVLLFADGTQLTPSDMMSVFELVEALSSADTLRFGNCEANSFEVSLLNKDVSYLGTEFDLMLYLNKDKTNPFYVGHYKVAEEKVSGDKRIRDIKAYDKLYDIINADVSYWYETQPFPMKLSDLRTSFVTYFGLTIGTLPAMVNDIYIDKTVDTAGISGKRVISSICELNGTFPIIDRMGRYSEVRLNNKAVKSYSRYYNATHDDYVTEKITKLQIRANADDIGTVYGTGDNTYIVEDNFLLYGKTPAELHDVAKNLFGVIKDVEYTPFTMMWRGNPCVEVGDRIEVKTKYGDFGSYVLARTIKGKRTLRDEYSAEGKQWQEEKVNASNYDIIQLKGKTNELTRDVNQTNNRITNVEQGLQADITATAGTINARIDSVVADGTQTAKGLSDRIDDLQAQMDGDIQQYNVDYVPTLTNYPAWDWTAIYCDDTVYCNDIPMLYTNEEYQRHARTLVYNEVESVAYRFTKGSDGTWFFDPIGDTEWGIAMKRITALELTTDGIKGSVSALDYKITNDYITALQAESLIDQKSSSILTQVSNKYATKDMLGNYAEISALSQVEQTANKISWLIKSGTSEANMVLTEKAYTLIADNIKLSGKNIVLDGNTTVNAGFTLTSSILSSCTMNGGAISIGGNNVIINDGGIFVMGGTSTAQFRVDNKGNTIMNGNLTSNGTLNAKTLAVENISMGNNKVIINTSGAYFNGSLSVTGDINFSQGHCKINNYGLTIFTKMVDGPYRVGNKCISLEGERESIEIYHNGFAYGDKFVMWSVLASRYGIALE